MLIPRVKNQTVWDTQYRLNAPVSVRSDDESDFIADVINEMMPYLMPTTSRENTADISVRISPNISVKNEFYRLVSKDGKVDIIAKDKRGAVNAIASLAQLIYEKDGKYYVDEIEIEDYPEKEFRSFMIDTGRKYIPIDELRAQILMMSKVKINKLHWHISD